ncbi:transcriptional regulator TrmB protein [Marine Group I thaumarchaeote SCGC AAA799-D11]|uniref:Transcriptional regulator TrmB protein n=1 Tax=Marine Group I thaumarchaeote SCGC AAA799-D11 TaxID=1502291 RepID=A0A087RRS7_9ARCH|nr:transcriptional regulator TrmB protein [Marine Group I thaumarchaeote SCGC AAA799-D11]
MAQKFTLDSFDDEFSYKILKSTKKFKTVSEISADCKIPISTTYRRIKDLQKNGVLEATGFIMDGVRFNKYKCTKLLKYGKYNPKVKQILSIITSNPGICYNELQENSKIPNGTLSHYISSMVKNAKIIVKRTSRRSWYFLPDTKPSEINLIINLRKETGRKILSFLLLHGPSSFTDIQKSTIKAPATISLTITHLVELELVKRIPGTRPKYELANRDLTFECIKKIEPNTSDKIKERFADTFSYL